MARPDGPVRWLHRLGFGKPRPEESVELEIEHHLAEIMDELLAAGWDRDDARREAELRFGKRRRYERRMQNIEGRQLASDRWAARFDLLRQSLVSVARMTRREPGFVAAVVLTLALGIGANATMFGIIDRLLLHGPEHVVEPDRVVRVLVERPGPTREISVTSFLSYPDYEDLRAHRGFAAVATYFPWGPLTVGSGETATTASVAGAAAEFFPLLGVQPHRGRFYTIEEAQPGSNPTAVLGFEYWRGAFAADPNAIGRGIEVEGVVYTVIGVAPPGFTGVDLRRVDVWIPTPLTDAIHSPLGAESLQRRGYTAFQVVARLNRGSPIGAAEAEATSLHLQGRREMISAGRYSDVARVVLGPLIAARGPESGGWLSNWSTVADIRVTRWLTGVSLIVLLIACANTANLLLARGTRRRREVGVRLALGAGRRVIVARAILEALALAIMGGILALLISRWGGEIVRSTLFPDVLFPASALTPRAVLFTGIATLIAGLSASILPAFQGGRHDQAVGLQRDGLGASPRRSVLRSTLTVAQAAMTVTLLVGAGLFLRSLQELRSIDLGLDVDRLAMVFLQFRSPTLDRARQSELVLEAAELAARLPSVASVAAASDRFPGGYPASPVRPVGVDSVPLLPGGGPYMYAGSPEFFGTVGLAITRGRGIDSSDLASSERIAVVSETMARTFWPERDPIDQCLLPPGSDECAFRVVGVVEDAARSGFRDASSVAYYVPATQATGLIWVIFVRARGEAEDVVADLRALGSFAPEVRSALVETVRDSLDPQARSWTLGATMFTVFGMLALIVAAIGLYSVLAFDVAQRTRELGIRTALGARKARLLRSVVYQGTRLGGLGVLLGLATAYVAAPYTQDLLFEVSPRDPLVLSVVGLVLLTVSLAASLVPGLRATRVDPMRALKTD